MLSLGQRPYFIFVQTTSHSHFAYFFGFSNTTPSYNNQFPKLTLYIKPLNKERFLPWVNYKLNQHRKYNNIHQAKAQVPWPEIFLVIARFIYQLESFQKDHRAPSKTTQYYRPFIRT